MPTLTGFTRPSDPIDSAQMCSDISTAVGSTVTCIVTPTDVEVTGNSISESNRSTIQTVLNSYYYRYLQAPGVPLVDNPDMSTARHNMAISEYAAYVADSSVAALANNKTAVRFYDNGIALNGTPRTDDIIVWIDTVVTSSGNAIFYMTSDHTSSGTALCKSISSNSVDAAIIDSAGVYARGAPTVAASLKSITVPITKQAFNGVTVLGINVLGSAAQSTAPNGVTVKIFAVGVAA